MNRLFLALLIMLSAACSVAPKQIALHDFGVHPNPSVTVGVHPALHATDINTKSDITVDTPLWLINDCIYYRLLYASPTQLRCYNLDKWIAPPAELFKQQLLASGQFSTHRLIIHLLDFEQQFDTAQQTRVVLNFVVDVYDAGSDRLLATQAFHLQQATATADAAGAVAGFAHLTQQAGDKIQHWLMNVH
jgi:cholesterol transport system auxiliary component